MIRDSIGSGRLFFYLLMIAVVSFLFTNEEKTKSFDIRKLIMKPLFKKDITKVIREVLKMG